MNSRSKHTIPFSRDPIDYSQKREASDIRELMRKRRKEKKIAKKKELQLGHIERNCISHEDEKAVFKKLV